MPTPPRPESLPVCRCTKVEQPHEHGTRGMYGWHRCRCLPCIEANRAYYHATAHLTRKHQWVDAEPARRRVLLLRDAGLGIKAMAEMCGVSASQLHFLVRGPKGRPVQRVYASTLAALNAITYRDVAAEPLTAGTRVDPSGARRQLQALTAAGWSMAQVARRSGVNRTTLIGVRGGDGLREGTRARIHAAHEELIGAEPPLATRYERSAAGTARAAAAARGWTVHQGHLDDDAATVRRAA